MRTSKVAGRLRFSPEDHLTTTQIKSYFSKLTNTRRRQTPLTTDVSANNGSDLDQMDSIDFDEDSDADGVHEDDTDFDSLVHETQRQELRLEVHHVLGSNALWDEEKS